MIMALATATRRPLTDEELAAVTDEIATDGEVAGIVALWSILLGYPLADHEGSPVDVAAYAIPEEQWRAIGAACVAASKKVAGGWGSLPGGVLLNNGPSSYEPRVDEGDDWPHPLL